MGRVIKIADKIVNGCLFFLTLVLVFTTGTQISLRVLFDLPLSWTEEVARYAFIWWVFFGAMIALRERRHLGIDALVTLFPRRLLRYWEIGIYVCILGYLSIMFIQGIKLARIQMIHNTPITDVPLGWIVLIIPLSALFMGLYTIQLMREGWQAGEGKENFSSQKE
jgi:TRAP-type C4-dicarboxylate transport system permease small subunit